MLSVFSVAFFVTFEGAGAVTDDGAGADAEAFLDVFDDEFAA
jgi:hypothetical protein